MVGAVSGVEVVQEWGPVRFTWLVAGISGGMAGIIAVGETKAVE